MPAPHAAAEAEAHYLRMWRLRQMSSAELRVLLAGAPSEIAPWVESAARYGLIEAQTRLGQMRLDGSGVARDKAAALEWFTRAADAGSPEAMNMVGRCLENGWGGPEDLIASAHWYRRSAEAGYDWGEYNYANMLFDGRGVECDQSAAVIWYRRASERGHARAMNLLARCYEEGWGVARDPKSAWNWYRRSAEGGYFRAQFNFATLLAGQGRMDEALGWFDQACRAATPESLPGMIKALAGHGDPRLAALADEIGRTLEAA
jgi:TPR repeat protein